MHCKFCESERKSVKSLAPHEARCKSNPNRITASLWTDEQKARHSKRMNEIVQANPDSYSTKNVSGRVKMHEVGSSECSTKVKG